MQIRFALLLLAAAATAAQAEIFQWKDEHGRTHFGEEVPAKYQKAAKPVETGKINTMQAQPPLPRAPAPAPLPENQPDNQPEPPASVPAAPLSETERCEQEMQRFQESQACFARFRLASGAVRPEGYQACKPVPMPSGCSR